MRHRPIPIVAALLLVLTVAAVSISAWTAVAPGRHPSMSLDVAAALGLPAGLIGRSEDIGPVSPDQTVRLTVGLVDPRREALNALLNNIYDPSSPEFRRYRTTAQLAGEFGPLPEEVTWLVGRMAGVGLNATWRPGDRWLGAVGRAADVERIFGTSLEQFRSPSGITFTAPLRVPTVPTEWRHHVTTIDGFIDYIRPRQLAFRAGGMNPTDLLLAYNMQPLRDLGIDGSGQTVVVTVPSDGLRQAALDAFTTRYNLPPITYVNEAEDPETLEPGVELEMDLETIHAIAPGARLVVYTGARVADLADQAIAKYPGSIMSQSWGHCEIGGGQARADRDLATYEKAAGAGISVFQSSGDSGAYTCLDDDGDPPRADNISASGPSSTPWVTSVGGTLLSVNQDGTWYHETSWTWPIRLMATGGGPSGFYPRPAWQVAPGIPAASADSTRLTPDVAAIGYGTAIAASVEGPEGVWTPGWEMGGGTSLSAPVWAGMTALFNQYLTEKGLPRLGFMNPALYALARVDQPYPPFHDVVQGGNFVDAAGPGYDTTTGLGTPDAWNLCRDLEAYLRTGTSP